VMVIEHEAFIKMAAPEYHVRALRLGRDHFASFAGLLPASNKTSSTPAPRTVSVWAAARPEIPPPITATRGRIATSFL